MPIKRLEIWLANLNPQKGTEPGKIRPVLILQSDLLNDIDHGSTIICPISTNVLDGVNYLRIRTAPDQENQLEVESEILLDQIRAIDNKRLIMKIGRLPHSILPKIAKNIGVILDLDLSITNY